MTTITLTVKNFKHEFERHERGFFEALDAGVIEGAFLGARILRSKVPVDRGRLKRGVVVKMDRGPGGVVCRVVQEAPYAVYQETGTGPFTPPFQAILEWAARQGKNMGIARPTKRRRIKSAADLARSDVLSVRVSNKSAPTALVASPETYALARAVWASIRAKGIKAKWHTRDALPDMKKALGAALRKAARRARER